MGMLRTTVTTSKGATSRSWVYVVAGHRHEPLLGDKDADKPGLITFTQGRRAENPPRRSGVTK